MKMNMRYLFFAFMLLLAACNNSEQPVITLDTMPAREKELRDSIALFPDSIALRNKLINYFGDNGNIDVALSETAKAIAIDTANADLYDSKAKLLLLKDDTAQATLAYEKAVGIFPDPQYVMALGWLYAKTKNPKALEIGDALLQADKAKAAKEAWLIKGLYFSSIGDKQKAIAAFDNCLALDYTYMFAYREKAIALYETGKYEDAVKVLDKATTLQNNFDEGYYWMGQCYEKLNNINAAVDNYKKAVLYNPDFAEAKTALAKLGVK